MGGVARTWLALAAWLAAAASVETSEAQVMRAAYFYNYMDSSHLDSLAAAGFNRAIIRVIGDSAGGAGPTPLAVWVARGADLGVEAVPDWLLQSRQRLRDLQSRRRYVWGPGNAEPEVACPADSLYWRSALLDRANEILRVAPSARALAVDLELHWGSRHYYDAGPCRCPECLDEYTRGAGKAFAGRRAWRLSGLMAYQESRITDFLTSMLTDFATRHPGIEIGVLDLDKDSFVHRALARALARSRVPTTDYCERSYSVGGGPLRGARARLDALGLEGTRLVGGIWLKRFKPADLPAGIGSIVERADGYFVFTTYSLWQDPAKLTAPYALLGKPHEYWTALQEVNTSP